MRDFNYGVAERIEDAFAADGVRVSAIAGGTELLNWMRLGIAAPDTVVDVGRLEGLRAIRQTGEILEIGALATLNEVGLHPAVQEHARVLSQACLAAASPQIRNRATLGGNLLQKTRCAYFRAEAPLPWGCNKREPGSGCAAREGLNDRHAIFGWTDQCVATLPSDPAVALAALDAEVELAGLGGSRRVRVKDLHLSQEEATGLAQGNYERAAQIETRLEPGEVIVRYFISASGTRSAYVKVRERASYEYALVSAAAVIGLEDGRIARASIMLGSVAQKLWPLATDGLIGLAPEREALLPVLRQSLTAARPLAHNQYKIAMAAGAAGRAIVEAGELG
jgi:xanthine dehydrogenase YagS FAD-binding subunit